MAKSKEQFIQELIETAQENVWKNELAKLFAQEFGDTADKDVKIKACEHAIKKDLEYIQFLNKQCE